MSRDAQRRSGLWIGEATPSLSSTTSAPCAKPGPVSTPDVALLRQRRGSAYQQEARQQAEVGESATPRSPLALRREADGVSDDHGQDEPDKPPRIPAGAETARVLSTGALFELSALMIRNPSAPRPR